jgi:hypothetical protein
MSATDFFAISGVTPAELELDLPLAKAYRRGASLAKISAQHETYGMTANPFDGGPFGPYPVKEVRQVDPHDVGRHDATQQELP